VPDDHFARDFGLDGRQARVSPVGAIRGIAAIGSFQHRAAGRGRRSSIIFRMRRNISRGSASSAIWKTAYRPWVTTLAPILTTFTRSEVSDQRFSN